MFQKNKQKGVMQAMNEAQAQRFCCWFVKLGNVGEAAVQAGFPRETALEEGMKILRRKKYQQLVAQLRTLFAAHVRDQVMNGLERLAFGEAGDGVRLALCEECPTEEELRRMNLFNVSEIKKVKGGGVEVRFFDRQRAMERLMEYAGNADQRTAARSLLSAIVGADEDEV